MVSGYGDTVKTALAHAQACAHRNITGIKEAKKRTSSPEGLEVRGLLHLSLERDKSRVQFFEVD